MSERLKDSTDLKFTAQNGLGPNIYSYTSYVLKAYVDRLSIWYTISSDSLAEYGLSTFLNNPQDPSLPTITKIMENMIRFERHYNTRNRHNHSACTICGKPVSEHAYLHSLKDRPARSDSGLFGRRDIRVISPEPQTEEKLS